MTVISSFFIAVGCIVGLSAGLGLLRFENRQSPPQESAVAILASRLSRFSEGTPTCLQMLAVRPVASMR